MYIRIVNKFTIILSLPAIETKHRWSRAFRTSHDQPFHYHFLGVKIVSDFVDGSNIYKFTMIIKMGITFYSTVMAIVTQIICQ